MTYPAGPAPTIRTSQSDVCTSLVFGTWAVSIFARCFVGEMGADDFRRERDVYRRQYRSGVRTREPKDGYGTERIYMEMRYRDDVKRNLARAAEGNSYNASPRPLHRLLAPTKLVHRITPWGLFRRHVRLSASPTGFQNARSGCICWGHLLPTCLAQDAGRIKSKLASPHMAV